MVKIQKRRVLALLAGISCFLGVVTSYANTVTNPQDPYEKFNRVMFKFNEKLDEYILKPIATVYNKILPNPINSGIDNFFHNIDTVPTIANDLLQFNFYQATNDSWRLLINSTVGIGGLFDIAQRMNLQPYSNDFGLTLATWGIKDSDYLVLPFFGPNTVRDAPSVLVDYYPLSIYPYLQDHTMWQLYLLSVVNSRAQKLKFQSVMEAAAFDKYVFIRNAYMQRRAFQIEQNRHLSYSDRNKLQQGTLAPPSNYD